MQKTTFESFKDEFYVYAKKMEFDTKNEDINNDQSDNIKGCINYCMRYALRMKLDHLHELLGNKKTTQKKLVRQNK